MNMANIFENQQVVAIAGLIALVVVLFVVKRLILVRLEDKARSEASSMSDIYRVLVLSLNAPLNLLIFVIFIAVVNRVVSIFDVNDELLLRVLSIGIDAGLIITLFLFLERFVTYLLRRYQDQSSIVKNTSGIAGGAVRAVFAVLAILIILSTMGISITPIVASLGITSLAVALALQPTLENVFFRYSVGHGQANPHWRFH
ncbi:hypothetical protein KUL42_06000 [Alteromonas sp. KUL42]|nr:hypothetical protein KUL42_06000 [Alteromonas sp. KUL42]